MHRLRHRLSLVPILVAVGLAACDSDSNTTPPNSRGDAAPPTKPTDAGPEPDPVRDAGSDADAAAPAAFPAATATELQRALDRAAAELAPGAALFVHHPRHGTFAGAAGFANISAQEALTAAHGFRAGSMLKTLLATAVLQLVETGVLTLDQTVAQLLPETVHSRIAHSDAITVRMLLQHTSGIPEYAAGDFDGLVLLDPAHVWTLDELLTRVEALAPTGLPGAAWSYSSSNYMLLGEIVTARSGRPWRQVVTAGVIAPLGLVHSSSPEPGTTSCVQCARGYELVDGERIDMSAVDPSMAGPAGGAALITTPEDLSSFLTGLLVGPAFTKPDSVLSLLDFLDAELPEQAQTGYGLGITRFQLGDVQYHGHLGATAGYQGFMLFEPSSGMTLAGYLNQRGDLGAFLVPVLESLAALP